MTSQEWNKMTLKDKIEYCKSRDNDISCEGCKFKEQCDDEFGVMPPTWLDIHTADSK